ncbi:MAG: pyruvate kinase [Bacilli bacterium]|nr:pyruvate kinase [Bacilli bacterium]
MKKTKIIATLGPSSNNKEVIMDMIKNGVDVFRINLSHSSRELTEKLVKIIKKIDKELNTNTGILIDTKGPEIRVNGIANGYVNLYKENTIILTTSDFLEEENMFHITYKNICKEVSVGNRLLIDDGLVELLVMEVTDCNLTCKVLNNCKLFNNKSVNIPDVDLNMEFLSKEDEEDIAFASSLSADFVALSFVRSSNDVLDVNDLLIGLRDEHMQIISKIECKSALDDIDNIIKVSDGVMVARGDLGVELELETVPMIQKKIVKETYLKSKISIVATEMLSSMEHKNRPTRAEVSDVSNAVLDGVDALMLSGETAIGENPVNTVITMKNIIEATEQSIDYEQLLNVHCNTRKDDLTSSISYSVVETANILKAKAIVASTLSGFTAKKVSAFRPSCIIIAPTPNKKVATSLSLNWGVIPVLVSVFKSTDQIVDEALKISKKMLELEKEDKIIITGGFPFKNNKNTNFMKVEEII